MWNLISKYALITYATNTYAVIMPSTYGYFFNYLQAKITEKCPLNVPRIVYFTSNWRKSPKNPTNGYCCAERFLSIYKLTISCDWSQLSVYWKFNFLRLSTGFKGKFRNTENYKNSLWQWYLLLNKLRAYFRDLVVSFISIIKQSIHCV